MLSCSASCSCLFPRLCCCGLHLVNVSILVMRNRTFNFALSTYCRALSAARRRSYVFVLVMLLNGFINSEAVVKCT